MFIKTQKSEALRPIKDEKEKQAAQKTAAATVASKLCCGDPVQCGGCEHSRSL